MRTLKDRVDDTMNTLRMGQAGGWWDVGDKTMVKRSLQFIAPDVQIVLAGAWDDVCGQMDFTPYGSVTDKVELVVNHLFSVNPSNKITQAIIFAAAKIAKAADQNEIAYHALQRQAKKLA